MSAVERATTVTVNYFDGWNAGEARHEPVSHVPQAQRKTDQLADEMARSIEQSGVSSKSGEDIQKLVFSAAQEVAARHRDDAASDDEIAAAQIVVLAKLASHREGAEQMSAILGRKNLAQYLAQYLAGVVSTNQSKTVDTTKVAQLVINSDYTKSLGRVESTLGQMLQLVDGSEHISAADKAAFEQAVYDSDTARSAGPDTVEFLKDYLGNLARFKEHPNDLQAASDAIFGSYLVNFGDPAQGLSGGELENGIGIAMGLKPDHPPGSGNAALFSGEQLKTIRTIGNQIQNLGGKDARISAMPVLLDSPDSKAGIQKFMLWHVTTAQNKDIYVDTLGQAHSSVQDFIDHNKLGSGRFVVARDGHMQVNRSGKVDVQEVEKSSYSEQDAIKDAGTIRDALDKDDFIDWGTDEDAVYGALKSRTATEIDMIRKAYSERFDHGHADFDKDLHEEFDDDKAELERLNALLKGKNDKESQNEAMAAEIRAELDDFAVDEQSALKMFERIPAEERQTVAEAFAQKYGQSQKGAEAIDYLLSQCNASFNKEEMTRAKDLFKPENGDFETGAARDEAGKLRVAVDGMGTDEDTIFEVLSGKNSHQIQAIKSAYEEKYDETLESRLKDELNASEWTYAAKLLTPPPPNADKASTAKWEAERSAAHLYYAMEGLGTRKDIIKAELEGKSPQQVQAIIDAYDYKGQSLRDRLIDDLEGTEEQEILHLLDRAKVKDQASMEKWQTGYDAKRLHVAMAGLGDKDLIHQVLGNKSKAQIESISGLYKDLYGSDLRADLEDQLDGRDWIEVRQIYDGGAIHLDDPNADPETVVAEQIRRQRELSEYERQGLSWEDAAMSVNPVVGAFNALGSDEVRGGLQKLTHWDSDYETDRERLDRNLGDAEKALKEYKATGNPDKLAEAGRLAGFAENDVKILVQNKDALTNAVVTGTAVVVGTLVTLPVGGWGGVALAAGASALTAGVGYTVMDSQVGFQEIARQTLISGVAGGVGIPVRGASGAVAKVGLAEGAETGKTVALRGAEDAAVNLASGSAPRIVERGLLQTEARTGAAGAGRAASLREPMMTAAKLGGINNGAVALADVATDSRAWHDPKAAIFGVVSGVVSGAALGVTFLGSVLGADRLLKAVRQVRPTAESPQPFEYDVVLDRLMPQGKAIEAGPQRKMLTAAAYDSGVPPGAQRPSGNAAGIQPLVRDSADGVWKKAEDIVGTPSTPPSSGPATRTIQGEVVHTNPSRKPGHRTISLRLQDEAGQPVEVKAQVLGGSARSQGPGEGSLPEPANILLPGAKDTGQRWHLLKDDDGYFVVPRMRGASSDHPVPVDSPSAMHRRSQATYRNQRKDIAEHLSSPPPITYRGKDWEFVRVDGNDANAVVYLRPAGSQDQFVERAEFMNGTVFLKNRETGSSRKLNPNELEEWFDRTKETKKLIRSNRILELKQELKRMKKNAEPERIRELEQELAKVKERIESSRSERLLFRDADDKGPVARTWIRANVDSDMIRLKQPESRGIRVPLRELESVPVRLKGKERDGIFFLSLNNNGKLVVSKAGEEPKIAEHPDEIVGEHINRSSYEFGKVPVKSTRAERLDELTGARPPQGASHASPSSALPEYGIKPLPNGQIKTIKVNSGDELVVELTKFVKGLEPQTPLVIRQWRFDEVGKDGKKSPFMQDLVRAVCNHARSGASVDLVISHGKLSPDMEKTLAHAGVRVRVANTLPHKMVVHQKSIATPDKSIICTGPFDPKAGKRMEAMIELPPHLSRLYFQCESLAATPGSSVHLQQKYLADLAAHGVAIDRPDVGATYAARSYWALTRGAQNSIELYVKELASPEFTTLLLEKARQGVSVKIRLAEPDNDPLDNASARLILKTLRENPDLDFSVKTYEWNQFPYRHFNALIVDNEVGAFGTLYPWSNGLGQIDPAGSGTEHSLILAGEDLTRMQDLMKKAEEDLAQSHGRYLTVDEVPTVSIYGFRGAGSVRDLAAPDAPHPYVITGHVGYSFNGGETIYGFGPEVGDEISAYDAVKSLMNKERYPGKIDNDTEVFRWVANNPAVGRDGNPQVVIEQKTPFLRAQFERMKKEHENMRADGPLEDVLYGFPGPNEDTFNCATFPSRLGIPIPEETGNMRTYMPPLEESGRPWKPEEAAE